MRDSLLLFVSWHKKICRFVIAATLRFANRKAAFIRSTVNGSIELIVEESFVLYFLPKRTFPTLFRYFSDTAFLIR